MKKLMRYASLVFPFAVLLALLLGAANTPDAFSRYVDSTGRITLPDGYRNNWVHLGTWVLTSPLPNAPQGHGTGFHEVYTQPESVKAFKNDGRWPDGTVLVSEVRVLKWDDLPVGHVMYADELTTQFVMVRDVKGRFEGSGNWGDGWGWARFTASDRSKNTASDYKQDCMSCHDLAKETDYLFVKGYPGLK